MAECLLSVGLDVGTTTTQLIVSRLTVENRASGFAVPQMEITKRDILYRSPVHFTPLLRDRLVDGDKLRRLVEAEYEKAGIRREQVDTGAVIVTGETSRKENAKAVLEGLSDLAGEFVVATAGPDLESVLAAKGAGVVAISQTTGKRLLHMDIGGGTSNLALVEDGKILQTGCLNVGGRLLKFDPEGRVSYVSPELSGLTQLKVGDLPLKEQVDAVVEQLVWGLEMAAGLRQRTDLLDRLLTREAGTWQVPAQPVQVSFSGGVADCIEKHMAGTAFGDIGPQLGAAIRNSRLCRDSYTLGPETIGATVIGAGCHSARLSGSTVYYQNVQLPIKNLPVAVFSQQDQDRADFGQLIARRLAGMEEDTVVLALPGYPAPGYDRIKALARQLTEGLGDRPAYICLEADMAKALGQCMSLLLGPGRNCLCIDRIRLTQESYLDIGQPVGPALPVVVKTLILSQ